MTGIVLALPTALRNRASGLATLFLLAGPLAAVAQSTPRDGQSLFVDERKGNCAACHQVPGDAQIKSISRIGPALADIKARYPDRAKLRELIWNAGKFNANTIMPPYGKHHLLSDAEIDTLVVYVETL